MKPRRLESCCLVAQAVVTSLASAAVPAVYWLYASHRGGTGPPWRIASTTALLETLACVWTILVARALKEDRLTRFFPLVWMQSATALVTVAVFCVPLFEADRSFSPFFQEAIRIERERNRIPVLFTTHESYVGLADLYFQRILPRLSVVGAETSSPARTGSVDVLTTRHGLNALAARPGPACTVLTKHDTDAPGTLRVLYLLSCSDPYRSGSDAMRAGQ